MIDADLVRRLFHYDPDTGVFTRTVRTSNRTEIGDVAGCRCNHHWKISVNNKPQYAHRLAWLYVHGEWPPKGMDIDHINGDGRDNRLANLILCTHAQNSRNRGTPKTNTSGYKGVTWNKKERKWQAGTKLHGKFIRAGCFRTPEDAHAAYCELIGRLHGEFANTG